MDKKTAAKKKKEGRSVHSVISPADYRYSVKEVVEHLSPEAYTRYLCRVECALVKALHRRKVCGASVVKEVEYACTLVTAEDVASEEARIEHDIRALVNCIGRHVSAEAKPFIHMTATSYDIIDTARAIQYGDVFRRVVIPEFLALERTLIELALREAETRQIGRTHGQHAMPITFGFSIINYVNRLGGCIVHMEQYANELRGKFSGAVGAYNASSLFFDAPETFEEEVLGILDIEPALCSTQIAPPEPLIRLLHEIIVAAGVVANIARDMRHLQRSEIDEIVEEVKPKQVGSSTMVHKKNPIGFENIESLWKVLIGRSVTVYLDQPSEHQRDLTNSASMRTYPEIVNYAVYMAKRLNRIMKNLRLERENMVRNLDMQSHLIAGEPLYLVLAALGHSDAHEAVRRLSMRAREEKKMIEQIAKEDPEIAPYFGKMTREQKKIFQFPSRLYTGIAEEKTRHVAKHWISVFNAMYENKEKGRE